LRDAYHTSQSVKPLKFRKAEQAICHNRGATKQAKGDLDGAIADYSKAIELKPDFAEAYKSRQSLVTRSISDLNMTTTTAPQTGITGFSFAPANNLFSQAGATITVQQNSIALPDGSVFLIVEFAPSSTLGLVKQTDNFFSIAGGGKAVGYIYDTNFGWVLLSHEISDLDFRKGQITREKFLFVVDRSKLNGARFYFAGAAFSVRDFLGSQ
jgi:TPR repeat